MTNILGVNSNLLSTLKLPGFLSFLSIAFINSVVDLGHKIIIQNTLFKLYDDATQVALTAVVNALILLPFILLMTPAGFISDRFRKPTVMRWSAFLAIIITSLITLAYYQGWFTFAFVMTFVLATQSAIYSPAKYAYIRELAGEARLSAANGFMQSTVIIAILTGIILFTVLFEWLLLDKQYLNSTELLKLIAPLGWGLIALSIIEWLLSLRLFDINNLSTQRSFQWADYIRGQLFSQNIECLKRSSVIWYAIIALSFFWGISQTFLAIFPAFAKIVLAENNTIVIQGLLACSGLGIVMGSFIAGVGQSGRIKTYLIPVGAIGMIGVLFIIPLLTETLQFATFIGLFGLFGGVFIIPLNALIQLHSPQNELGRILAGNNWIQNIVMLSGLVVTYVLAEMNIASKTLLVALAIVTLLMALIVSVKWYKNRISR